MKIDHARRGIRNFPETPLFGGVGKRTHITYGCQVVGGVFDGQVKLHIKIPSRTALSTEGWYVNLDHFQTNQCSFAIENWSGTGPYGYGTKIWMEWDYEIDGVDSNCDPIQDLYWYLYWEECLDPAGCGGFVYEGYRFYKCPMQIDHW